MAYILGTVCVLLALPQSEVSSLQGLMEAIVKAAQRIGFAPIVPIAALLITLSNLGAAGAFLAAAARLPFVAGIDRFLPAAFASLHPRWRTPYIALLTQGIFGVLFIFLGQAGSTVKAAYDILVNIGVITYFIPYLFVFAALIRLQREVAGPDVIRVPGGKPIAVIVGTVGFAASLTTIVLSLIPPQGEVNKVLGVTKVVGLTMLLIASGVCLYLVGRRKIQAATRGSRA
jgi:amino acid transporter